MSVVAVKKPYLTSGMNRLSEIVNWQLLLTLLGVMLVSSGGGGKSVDALLLGIQVAGVGLAVLAAGCEGRAVIEEGNTSAVLPVLEEGESKDATIARLEREKEAALEEKGAAEAWRQRGGRRQLERSCSRRSRRTSRCRRCGLIVMEDATIARLERERAAAEKAAVDEL